VTDPLTVLLADDHAPTRSGVRLSLEGHGFRVCAEATTAQAAIDAARRSRPDVCLLDVGMPGGGIEAAQVIAREVPEAAIVMLTVSRSDADVFAALRAGAAGYLLKDTSPERLPHALRGVVRGEAALPRTLVTRLIDHYRGRARRRWLRLAGGHGVELSGREWDVLELLAQGLTTKEVADRLAISPVTVRRHVSALMEKAGVDSREDVVALLRGGHRA
jgi:DNA-binding NarL/FixJ family response regulator